jgi:hypothetical protein
MARYIRDALPYINRCLEFGKRALRNGDGEETSRDWDDGGGVVL